MHCRRVTLFLIVAVMPIILSACGAAHHSIFRNRTVRSDGPSIIAVDAKQRTILAVPHPRLVGTTREQQMRMCAEASPDVFSVIAQSLSATGTFEQRPDPASVQAAASLAASTSEQGSTIPRTQTINMLRELMYRTCERYLNGAISELEMPIQAVRDQRLMVAILAIEQLTGAVTPPTVVIGASASGSAGASSGEAVVRIDNARLALTAAETNLTNATNAYNALNQGTDSCDALEQLAAAGTPALTEPQTTKRQQCIDAKATQTAAQAKRQEAADHLAALRTASTGAGAGPVSTTTTVQEGDHGSGEIATAHSASIKDVAETVRFIVAQNYDQDEFLLFCIRLMSSTDPEEARLKEQVQEACLTYITVRIETQSDRVNAERAAALRLSATYRDTLGAVAVAGERQFTSFWSRVTTDSDLDRAKLAVVIDGLIASYQSRPNGRPHPDDRRLRELKEMTGREDGRRIFGGLNDRTRRELAGED